MLSSLCGSPRCYPEDAGDASTFHRPPQCQSNVCLFSLRGRGQNSPMKSAVYTPKIMRRQRGRVSLLGEPVGLRLRAQRRKPYSFFFSFPASSLFSFLRSLVDGFFSPTMARRAPIFVERPWNDETTLRSVPVRKLYEQCKRMKRATILI